MELRYCKKHFQMTNHELDSIKGWYCLKCVLENDRKRLKGKSGYKVETNNEIVV